MLELGRPNNTELLRAIQRMAYSRGTRGEPGEEPGDRGTRRNPEPGQNPGTRGEPGGNPGTVFTGRGCVQVCAENGPHERCGQAPFSSGSQLPGSGE